MPSGVTVTLWIVGIALVLFCLLVVESVLFGEACSWLRSRSRGAPRGVRGK